MSQDAISPDGRQTNMGPTVTQNHPARQAIAGVVPPSVGEARIREVFPAMPGVAAAPAGLAKSLVRTYLLAPLGWMIQAPLFGLKFAPMICRRYTLTNKRLMIQKGWKPGPVQEVPLGEIEDVRIGPGGVDPFYLCGDLEVVARGQVVLRLAAAPEPENFRQAVLNAVKAWAPPKGAPKGWVPASANVEGKG
jgi:hypothetical protein